MSASTPTDARSVRTRTAIADAAEALFAEVGPDRVSLREIATGAGCSHALVSRYFGSKDGLKAEVVDRVATWFASTTTDAIASCGDGWPFAALLDALDAAPGHRAVLVRSALGELPDRTLAGPDNPARAIAALAADRMPAGLPHRADAAAVTAYVCLSLLLGWCALDGFLMHAARLRSTARRRRLDAVVAGCERIAALCVERADELAIAGTARRPRAQSSVPAQVRGPERVRAALAVAAAELLGSHGPASTTRQIADRAGVNQGQIYHLYGSKEALLDAAIEMANRGFVTGAIQDGHLDLDAAARLRLEARTPFLLARLIVDGVDIGDVRSSYPVCDALLARYPRIPTGRSDGALSDPRIAVMLTGAFYQGSMVWDPLLRQMLGVARSADLDAASDLVTRTLVGLAETP